MSTIRTILHPTDFSDCARCAFRVAGMLAREQGARLVILHVNPVLGPMAPCGGVLAALEPEDSRERVLGLLHRLQVADPKVQVEHRLVDGEGAPEILGAAAEVGADLIVMGTHGRTGISGLFVGSVAREVQRNAHCPVVTVKLPHHAGSASSSPAPEPVSAGATTAE